MAKKKNRPRSTGRGQLASMSTTKSKAHTPRLEDVHFTHGTSMAAVKFSETQSKLSRYVGSKPKGAMGAKAIMNLEHLNLAELEEPMCVMIRVQIDNKDTKEGFSVPVLSDVLFNFAMEKYMTE